MNRRRALSVLGGLGAAGLLSACGDDVAAGDTGTIRIGLMAPSSGALKTIGEELTNGFTLFLSENANALAGRPVELIRADEGETTDSGLQALKQLFGQNVTAVIGVANSALLDAAAPEIDKARIPVLAANGIPEKLQGATFLWSTSYAEHEPGVALGPWVRQKLKGGDDVAIVAPSTASGEDAVNGFRFSFGPGDKRLAPTIWTPPELGASGDAFTAAVQKIRETDAAAVYCYYAGTAAVSFLKQLRGSGSKAIVYAPGLLTEGSVLAELGDAGQGILTALNYSADLDNSLNRRFTDSYRRAHNRMPSAAAVGAYDAGQVLDKALLLVKTKPTPEDVYFALDNVGQIVSPRGAWQFNHFRTPMQRWYLREVRRDGPVLANVTLNELTTLG
jgi:branched-chain amino acid transport system substrate-binding protein